MQFEMWVGKDSTMVPKVTPPWALRQSLQSVEAKHWYFKYKFDFP